MVPQLVDRFHPRLRRSQQALIDAGQFRQREALALLEPQQMRPVILLSLLLLIVGTVIFGALNIAAYVWQTHAHSGSIGGWTLIGWLLINVLAYIVVLPIHELIHGLVISFWGGKPYYGAKLPFALFCGARNQIFRRSHYLVIALAPLVVLTLAGVVFLLIAPALASYVFLGLVGNFSGAAGDIYSAARILKQPTGTLIEDTETGFRTWELESPT
ncbi:MAG: DUF3267 domain-containing protein [Ktedonobacteraceae bacterium]|nr:DUF3267 domain-containing protein [Ktedonobacteraceae bacterium]